jgi:hypothetical protein
MPAREPVWPILHTNGCNRAGFALCRLWGLGQSARMHRSTSTHIGTDVCADSGAGIGVRHRPVRVRQAAARAMALDAAWTGSASAVTAVSTLALPRMTSIGFLVAVSQTETGTHTRFNPI